MDLLKISMQKQVTGDE